MRILKNGIRASLVRLPAKSGDFVRLGK